MPSLRLRLAIATFVAVLVLASPAFAGPPLICHPFAVSGEPLLPWTESRNWHSPDRSYDVQTLTRDTLELLSDDAPVLARMENLRRATIYAADRPDIGVELLRAVMARIETVAESSPAAALAWFDAGYLVESYRQFDVAQGYGMLPGRKRWPLLSGQPATLDGYALVEKAIGLARDQRSEMEFAASLMSHR